MRDEGAATELTRRAAALRRLAVRLEAAKARTLFTHAGSDTWIGPTPSFCLDQMIQVNRTVTRAADDLNAAARGLETQADLLSAGGGGGGGGRMTVR